LATFEIQLFYKFKNISNIFFNLFKKLLLKVFKLTIGSKFPQLVNPLIN
jgi:hypothetical protein